MTIRTSDLDEARGIIDRNYYDHVIETLTPGPVRARFDLTTAGPVTIGEVVLGADVRMSFGDLGAYHLDIPLSGDLSCRQDGRPDAHLGPGQGVIFQPEGSVAIDRWSGDCRLLAVKIDAAALEEQLAGMLDEPVAGRIVFEPGLDLSRGRGETWLRLLRLVAADAQLDDGLVHHPEASARLRDTLMSSLLLSAGHQHRAALDGAPVRQVPSRVVARAVDAIRADPGRPYTVTDLARLARVSRRTLQAGFQRHLGTTPMAYLREARLELAHDRLQAADPASVTVAGVAHAAGFTHLGRFAASYRQRYGIAPSRTLRR